MCCFRRKLIGGFAKIFIYKSCRELGQLGEFKVCPIPESAPKIYLTHKSKESGLGTPKYSLLERQTDWLEVFENKQPDLVAEFFNSKYRPRP